MITIWIQLPSEKVMYWKTLFQVKCFISVYKILTLPNFLFKDSKASNYSLSFILGTAV